MQVARLFAFFEPGDPMAKNYTDEALTPITAGAADHFVEAFADKIPKTHGAPVAPVRKRRSRASWRNLRDRRTPVDG